MVAGDLSKTNGSNRWLHVPVGRVGGNLLCLFPHSIVQMCVCVCVCVTQYSRHLITPSEIWITRFPCSGRRQSHIRLWWMVWGCFQWWICWTRPGLTVTHWAAKNGTGVTSSVFRLEIFLSCCLRKCVFTSLITDRDGGLDFWGKSALVYTTVLNCFWLTKTPVIPLLYVIDRLSYGFYKLQQLE